MTPEQIADEIIATINGMTFDEDDGAEGWARKVRPVISQAIRKDQERAEDQMLTEYWLKHYVPHGHCMLCGNNGTMDTTEIAITPAGTYVGGRTWCICPNGQKMREQSTT